MPAVIMVLVAVIAYRVLAPLPSPIPPHGQVIDATRGKPVSGAQLRTRWRLYDYPMLDGAGSYEVSSVTITDAKGQFSLVIPRHRRGLWNTETYPPSIKAAGYRPFTFDDAEAVQYANNGESVVIKLTPEGPEGSGSVVPRNDEVASRGRSVTMSAMPLARRVNPGGYHDQVLNRAAGLSLRRGAATSRAHSVVRGLRALCAETQPPSRISPVARQSGQTEEERRRVWCPQMTWKNKSLTPSFHKEYKPSVKIPNGARRSPDLTDEQLLDAYLERLERPGG
jgi:hypothetical protein